LTPSGQSFSPSNLGTYSAFILFKRSSSGLPSIYPQITWCWIFENSTGKVPDLLMKKDTW